MSDEIVSIIITKLKTLIEDEIKLVVGVDDEIRNLETTFNSIKALLADADRKQFDDETVKLWLQRLRNVSYEMDDVLSEWSTAILKLRIDEHDRQTSNFLQSKILPLITFPCFSFNRVAKRHDIANQVKEISAKLDLIDKDKDKYQLNSTGDSGTSGKQTSGQVQTTSVVEESNVFGRDEDKTHLVSELCGGGDNERLHIVSIVGMGGIGKTTLAQLVYDCSEVVAHFGTNKMWVCVSEIFDEVRVAKAIVEQAEGTPPNCVEYEMTLIKVKAAINGKRFLLVLDNVWSDDDQKWGPLIITLKSGAPGSKILVTTQYKRLAKMMGVACSTIQLRALSDDQCWSLFHHIAFSERNVKECRELEDTGRRISRKCKGLPLAAKTIASLLRFERSPKEWKNVLNSEIWEKGEVKEGIFPPLQLSYYYLPSPIKRCFSYCATFPKDYKIEADNLIKIWMAHGYISSKDVEKTGREYLDTLILGSFFQNLEKDKNSDVIVRFKMHDMIHDFARYLTKEECSMIMNPNDGTEQEVMQSTWQNLRHLTVVRADETGDAGLLVPPNNTERLHTFWVQSLYDSPPIVTQTNCAPVDLFHRLKYVKVLDLSRNMLTQLPEEVNKLMNLRYLNLSHNPLFELPETVCCLCNLQTLKLLKCDHLYKLPSRIDELVNLRHLEIDRTDALRKLPKGIGKLASLRTLSKFIVVNGEDEASCKLQDLRNLTNLRGSIKIEGLGHVTDVEGAKKADLKNKDHLVDVQLDFSTLMPPTMAEEMIKALQLHPSLENLQVKLYGGCTFPNWINSLTSLKKLQLLKCENCTKLPPLGKLPFLETLYIENFPNLVRVDHEFLGIERVDVGQTTGSSSSIVAFPELKKLKFVHMASWEEWDMEGAAKGIMPQLCCLKLSHCNKLKSLPQQLLETTELKKFRVHHCQILHQRYQNDIGEDWFRVSHIPKIRVS